jgi:hypothetical protein
MQVHIREGTRCAHIAPQTIEFWRRHVLRPGEVDAENASIRPGPSQRHALRMVAYLESENASVSISMKMRPSVPTQQ